MERILGCVSLQSFVLIFNCVQLATNRDLGNNFNHQAGLVRFTPCKKKQCCVLPKYENMAEEMDRLSLKFIENFWRYYVNNRQI